MSNQVKAVFVSQDVPNTFEAAISKKHNDNYVAYKTYQLTKNTRGVK